MKLKRLFLFGLSAICFIMTVAFGSQTVSAQETKSETLYKYIQATHDIPYLPVSYQYTDWQIGRAHV